jgi:hypothetical protein
MEGLGARDLSQAVRRIALACAWLAPGVAPFAQEASPLEAAHEAHWNVVLTERTERFLAGSAAADPAARERGAKVLERMRSPGSGLLSPPSLAALARAQRALRAADSPPEQERMERTADALDLQPAPGVFESRAEGEGVAVTVGVVPLTPLADRADIQLSLYWIAPDGNEQLARREPVRAAALEAPGFQMFLRTPRSAPGMWQLVAECERDGVRARGAPVEVECVERLDERLRRVFARSLPPQSPAAMLAIALALRHQSGLRTLASLRPSEMLRQIERALPAEEAAPTASPALEPGVVAPCEQAFVDARKIPHWVWSLRPEGEIERVVILLAPWTDAPEAVLQRESWRKLAGEGRAWMLSTHLPDSAGKATGVAELLTRLRALAPAGKCCLVARGGSVGTLLLGVETAERDAPLPFDALVMSTVISSPTPEKVLPQVRRLLLAPGGARELPQEPASFTWLEGSRIPLLNEPRLPELIARWR